jgi:ribosomal protein S18 acetylase RimI-like enzyme
MVRLAQNADAPAVHAILWAAKAEIPLLDNFADVEHQKWIQEQCKSGAVWLSQQEIEITGIMVIKAATKISTTEIFYLAVRSEKRRTGTGRALITHAKKKWSTGLRARVKPHNTKIIGLLESEGFECESGEDTHGYDWVWYSWLLS